MKCSLDTITKEEYLEAMGILQIVLTSPGSTENKAYRAVLIASACIEMIMNQVSRPLSTHKILTKKLERIEVKGLCVDYRTYKAYANKKLLILTPKEFEILGFFLKNPDQIIKKSDLYENIWGNNFMNSTRTVEVHIDSLRHKLGRFANGIKCIKAVGYRFEPKANL